MTPRDTPWPHGTPCWVEIRVDDPVGTAGFYRGLFGWELHDQGAEFDHYLTAALDGRPVADIGPRRTAAPGNPDGWLVCLAARDADAAARRVTGHGGTLPVPVHVIGSHGRFAVAADPIGAAFGIWQEGDYFGARIGGVPGAAVWHQCVTPDPAAATAFHTAVFGRPWTRDGDGGHRTLLDPDGRAVAGAGPAEHPFREPGPAHWEVTFGVAALDGALTRVTGLGGAVLAGPSATARGATALAADPLGNRFRVAEVARG
ncbi:VOC family protein [Streptomyces sp. NPDC021100]|uniref:VOC family protein n=1 Tax=Streptomyces sp. NPDC021100 TaxID=3365114 RepID=UPI0037A5ED25